MERNREKERRGGGGRKGGKIEGEEKRVLGFGMKNRGPSEEEERRSGGSKDLPIGK